MLSIVYTAVPDNIDGKHAVLVLGDDFLKNGRLVDNGAHRKRVVPWHEYKVGEGGITDIVAFYVGIEGYVALGCLVHKMMMGGLGGIVPWRLSLLLGWG